MNSITLLARALLFAPLVAAAVLSLRSWFGTQPSERFIQKTTAHSFLLALLASGTLLLRIPITGQQQLVIFELPWFHLGGYENHLRLVADGLSLSFAFFSAALLGTIGAFSTKYLHREPGYLRYYLLLCFFGAATFILVFAGSLDFIFFGWEVVGFTSTLLIAFFHERRSPVAHGLRAFIVYRICDIGLLAAIVWLHHAGHGHAAGEPARSWWGIQPPEQAIDATLVGLFLVFASLGKAAQVPFGGWLPRAMEGPTPSSAIFYGAISVHLGPYLLLRAAPVLEAAPHVALLVVGIGATTAVYGTFAGRVQTDVKSTLAFASMVQVGLIFVEIGLGLRLFALAHIVGHAALRCLQILRSPSIIHDHLTFERQRGDALPKLGGHLERLFPRRLQLWLYRGSLERGFLDSILEEFVVSPVLRMVRQLNALDEAWVHFLLGEKSKKLVAPEPPARQVYGGES